MSQADPDSVVPHPRETTALFGHAEAEQTLLAAYRSGRIPHAWLIGGEGGIGKATLAYRMARFVLAHPLPQSPAVRDAESLAVPADHPVTRRIAGQAHSDLLTLERVINEKTNKLFTIIRVDDVRRIVGFFGSTAGEGGWRIAVVDSVDELASEGENALLKLLEEPPPRSMLLLVAHSPGRVLPTIRSRCRQLMLRPLATPDVAQALATALGRSSEDEDIQAAAEPAEGSVARAVMFMEGPALEMRQRMIGLLDQLPRLDQKALHQIGDKLAGTQAETLAAFMDTVNSWLSRRLDAGSPQAAFRAATAWEKVNSAAAEADTYNLDRKPLVFAVFGALAEAARG